MCRSHPSKIGTDVTMKCGKNCSIIVEAVKAYLCITIQGHMTTITLRTYILDILDRSSLTCVSNIRLGKHIVLRSIFHSGGSVKWCSNYGNSRITAPLNSFNWKSGFTVQ